MKQKQKLIYELLSALFIFSGFIMSATLYLTLPENVSHVSDSVVTIASLLLLVAIIFFCNASVIKYSEKCTLSHEMFTDERMYELWKKSFRSMVQFDTCKQLCWVSICWTIMSYLVAHKDYVLDVRSIAVVLTVSVLSLLFISLYLLYEYRGVISSSSEHLDNDNLQTSDDMQHQG